MKRILIISPHFPPSNQAAVHRGRLFARHLPDFGYEAVILAVHENFYEERLDYTLEKLLPADLRIEKTSAFRVTKPRVVGDLGLRGFFQLYRKAKKLITSEQFDFLYILIPSFYTALLGRWLHHSTGIKYGIDYIDPWVHTFPGSDKIFSRHWFSTRLARFLEPIAVKRASLITGVAESYYKSVLERNPGLLKTCQTGAMPYGGEESDHLKVKELGLQPYLFNKSPGKQVLVYAGAMLPKAYAPLEAILQSISANPELFLNLEIHFIGTGKTANDPEGYNIKPLAEKYGLWKKNIFEYPAKIPYLDVLAHLEAAQGVFILGSTEAHYTPSKVYQAVLSKKPILAVLHIKSSACSVIRLTRAGVVLAFEGEEGVKDIAPNFSTVFGEYLNVVADFKPTPANDPLFDPFSARSVTRQLTELFARI